MGGLPLSKDADHPDNRWHLNNNQSNVSEITREVFFKRPIGVESNHFPQRISHARDIDHRTKFPCKDCPETNFLCQNINSLQQNGQKVLLNVTHYNQNLSDLTIVIIIPLSIIRTISSSPCHEPTSENKLLSFERRRM